MTFARKCKNGFEALKAHFALGRYHAPTGGHLIQKTPDFIGPKQPLNPDRPDRDCGESLDSDLSLDRGGVAIAPPPLGDPNLTASDPIEVPNIDTEDSVYPEYRPAAPIDLSPDDEGPDDIGPVPEWHKELDRHYGNVKGNDTSADGDYIPGSDEIGGDYDNMDEYFGGGPISDDDLVEDDDDDADDDDAEELTDPFSDGDDDWESVPRGVRTPSDIDDIEIPWDDDARPSHRARASARGRSTSGTTRRPHSGSNGTPLSSLLWASERPSKVSEKLTGLRGAND